MNLPTIFLYFVKQETFAVKNKSEKEREREDQSFEWWWWCIIDTMMNLSKNLLFFDGQKNQTDNQAMFVDYISQMLFALLLEFFFFCIYQS